MSRRIFSRWCCPRTVLVLIAPSDDPAQVLTAVRYAERSGAKLLLAQMSPEDPSTRGGVRFESQSMPQSVAISQIWKKSDSRHSFTSLEVFRKAFVLNGVSHAQIPALVRTFNIDRVLLTQSRSRERPAQPGIEEKLMSTLTVPLWIMGRGMALNLGTPPLTRRILLPVSHSSEVEFSFQFACELATIEGASLSILHVFGKSEAGRAIGERSPLIVKSWLPLSKIEGIASLCPIELVVRQGDPTTEILEFNARKPHELVVLQRSSTRREGSSSKPSIVSRLCSQLPCPVLVLGNAIEAPARQACGGEISVRQPRARLNPAPVAVEG